MSLIVTLVLSHGSQSLSHRERKNRNFSKASNFAQTLRHTASCLKFIFNSTLKGILLIRKKKKKPASHIRLLLAFDAISVKKKEHSHMSQIPAAASPKKQWQTTKQQKQPLSQSGSLSVGAGARVPFQVQLQQLSSKQELSGNLCFPPNPHGLNLTLFLQAWWRITCSYSLIARVHFLMTYSSFFPLSSSLIYNSFDLKFH